MINLVKMTLVYEVLGGESEINSLDNSVNIDELPLSTNIERMRRKITKLINEDKEKALYSNIVRYLLEYDDDDMDNTTNLSIDEIRSHTKSLNEKMNNELIEYMKKEVKSLKLCEIIEFITISATDEPNYSIDIMNLKSNIAYIINNINLNTNKFCSFVDQLSELYDKVWIIKCFVDDCYTERIVIVVKERNEKQIVVQNNKNILVNQEKLINFLYSIYSKAIFILQTNEEEYKKLTEYSLKVLKSVKLF